MTTPIQKPHAFKRPFAFKLASVAAAVSFPLLAAGQVAPQPVPDAGRVLENLRAPVIITPPNATISVEDRTPAKKLAPPTGAGAAAKLAIKGFKVTGLSVPLKADAGALLGKFIGAERTFDDLEAAADALQVAIRQEGLFLAQVDVPPQKVEDGMIELRVLEGRLDSVDLATLPEGLLVKQEQIESILARLQPGDLLTVDKIERVLFLLSDLRGINVSSVVSPGAKPGTAKLGVSIKPGDRFEKNVDFDNYGSVYTGEYRLSAAVGVNSPLGRGDLFKLTGNVSTTGGVKFIRAAYQSPVGGSGLKLGAAVSALQYRLGTAAFEPLKASGDAAVVSLFGLYPVVRNRNFNTFAQVNYDRRNFHDVQTALAIDNRKHSDVVTMGLVGDSRDQVLSGGVNTFSLGLTAGSIALESPVQLAADQAATGRKINGSFSKINYGAGRQQLLWSKADNSADRLVVYVSFQGQAAAKNLDNSEKFSLGGPSGVRGYASGEATGDSGNLLNWELRKNIIHDAIKGDFVLSAFGDYGRITVNRNPLATDLVNSISLVSHGFGLAWAVPDSFLLKASIAWRGSYVPVADPNPTRLRAYISLSKTL